MVSLYCKTDFPVTNLFDFIERRTHIVVHYHKLALCTVTSCRLHAIWSESTTHHTARSMCYRRSLFTILSALLLSSSEGSGTAIGLGVGSIDSCVIRASDNSLVCFGDNEANQLGYGKAVSRYFRVIY
jgi:hypothetical protein